eukprot:m.48383 g.48383  ORF g.48383 m.48383 type:complete len:53 (+) comp14954_c0_seq2:55-213(+)
MLSSKSRCLFPHAQAKKLVEDLPKVLKKDISKEEADKIQKALQEAGAEVVVE